MFKYILATILFALQDIYIAVIRWRKQFLFSFIIISQKLSTVKLNRVIYAELITKHEGEETDPPILINHENSRYSQSSGDQSSGGQSSGDQSSSGQSSGQSSGGQSSGGQSSGQSSNNINDFVDIFFHVDITYMISKYYQIESVHTLFTLQKWIRALTPRADFLVIALLYKRHVYTFKIDLKNEMDTITRKDVFDISMENLITLKTS